MSKIAHQYVNHLIDLGDSSEQIIEEASKEQQKAFNKHTEKAKKAKKAETEKVKGSIMDTIRYYKETTKDKINNTAKKNYDKLKDKTKSTVKRNKAQIALGTAATTTAAATAATLAGKDEEAKIEESDNRLLTQEELAKPRIVPSNPPGGLKEMDALQKETGASNFKEEPIKIEEACCEACTMGNPCETITESTKPRNLYGIISKIL